MAYKRTKHPLVSFVRRRRNTRDVLEMQWVDPDTRKKQQRSLTRMGYKSKSEAMKELIRKSKELKAARERIDKGQRREGIDEEWTTIFSDYFKHYAAENSEDAAKRNKRDWLCRWETFLETKKITRGAHLKPAHLAEFRLQLSKDLGKRTRNRHLDAVKALLKWCIDRGNVRIELSDIQGTFSKLKHYKPDEQAPVVLEATDIMLIIDAVQKRDKQRKSNNALLPFVLLGLLTGARPSEVLSFRWEHVYFERKQVMVWGAKTKRQRAIPMHDSDVLIKLLEILEKRKGNAVHVCGDAPKGKQKGKPRRLFSIRKSWDTMLKKTKLKDTTPKALRSTCIAHVASGTTEPEYLLEARFGHGRDVSKAHYRQPLHGIQARGNTVEAWLGIKKELDALLVLMDS